MGAENKIVAGNVEAWSIRLQDVSPGLHRGKVKSAGDIGGDLLHNVALAPLQYHLAFGNRFAIPITQNAIHGCLTGCSDRKTRGQQQRIRNQSAQVVYSTRVSTRLNAVV